MLPVCSCSTRISKDKLAEMMIEMYMVDYTIQDHSEFNPVSDTTLVYAAILRKHGYSVIDFENALARHLQKPDKFKKTLAQYREQIMAKRDVLLKEIALANRKPDTLACLRRFIPTRPIPLPYSPLMDSAMRQSLDSLKLWEIKLWEPDTAHIQVPLPVLKLPKQK